MPVNNIIYVDDETGLYEKTFISREINLMKVEEIKSPMKVRVKIRYKDRRCRNDRTD